MSFEDIQKQNGFPDDEIQQFIQDYLGKTASIKDHKLKEQYLMEMLSLLLAKINKIAKEGDDFEVADNLSSAAYYMEEFDYKEAKEIYLQAIQYYDKYMNKLQKEGQFEEASWTANQIAELYRMKLNNLELEEKYVLKCIEYNQALVELINGFSKARKITTIMYNIGELYSKIEYWDDAIKVNYSALEIAKKERFYDLTSNLFFNLSDIYLIQTNDDLCLQTFKEAEEYFLNEESICVQKKDHYSLSQIYQILKNLKSSLKKPAEFKNYSRKEAVSYIELAKNIIRSKGDLHKVASFYRGAALCFKETAQDYLEGASCFLIAGKFFQRLEEFTECSLCFNDAAESFEDAGLYDKSVGYYKKAAEFALVNSNFEFAIEKLINAYDVAETKNLSIPRDIIAKEINANLELLSNQHAQDEKYFMAGTLLLESLPYYKKMGFSNNSDEIRNILNKIDEYYNKEFQQYINEKPNSTISYILSLTALLKVALDDYNAANEIIGRLGASNSNITKAYQDIVRGIMEAKRNNQKFDLSNCDKKVKKTFSNSEEIKLFNNFFFF